MDTETLKRFANNKAMCDAVYDFVLTSFLRPVKTDDVHTLAASRIAIDLLNKAWVDIAAMRALKSEPQPTPPNPGI